MSNVDAKSMLNLESLVSVRDSQESEIDSTSTAHITRGDEMVSEFDTRHDTRFNSLDNKSVNVDITDVEFGT